MKKIIIFILIFSIFFFAGSKFSHTQEKVKLRADHIYYGESKQILIASTNASLTHKDLEIKAPILYLNTKDNILFATGNIIINKDNREIKATDLKLDLNKNLLTLKDLKIEFEAMQSTQNVYIKAEKLSDKKGKETGKKGWITTCDQDNPHYYMSAESFLYYPDKRIVGQNVIINYPLGPIPFAMWTPAYIYDLGKRKVVYLMPVMGSNREEGGFYKSTFDYYFAQDNYGHVYVDFISAKGIGLGMKHHYMLGENNEGSLYHYNISQKRDFVTQWDQNFQITEPLSYHHNIRASDMYLISGGRTKQNDQDYQVHYDDLGDEHKIDYKETESTVLGSNTKRTSFSYDKTYNQRKEWAVKIDKNENIREDLDIVVEENHMIAHDFELRNAVNYQRNQQIDNLNPDKELFDDNLETSTTIIKKIENVGTIKTEFAKFFDLNEEASIPDDNNTYVEKIPELTFNANALKTNFFDYNINIIAGRYKESYLIPGRNNLIEIEASRYIFEQKISKTLDELPLNSSLNLYAGYNQYVYDTEDKLFVINWGSEYNTDWFNFIKTKSNYTRAYRGEDLFNPKDGDMGNTPFYFDEKAQLDTNLFNEQLTLYLFSPSKYKWDLRTGYDWIREKQIDYKSEINIKPSPRFHLNLKSGWRIEQEEYDPLILSMLYKFKNELSYNLTGNHDLNNGELTNLTHKIQTILGNQSWETRWTIDTYITYAKDPKKGNFYHQLQTISLTKDLHCRKITLTYDRLMEEFRIQFSINAFPEDTFGFSRNKDEDFKLEGVFDDESVQRN